MSTQFKELGMDQIVIHPKNVRRDVGNVVDLANSITAQGILQPLVVAPDLTQSPDKALGSAAEFRYVLIAGHRREAAARLANLDALPCVIREDLDTESKQIAAMMVENTQRKDLTMMEQAYGFQTLLDFPENTLKQVARNLGRSQKMIKDRAKLTTLPQGAIDKIEQRQMTLEDALVLAEFGDNPDATADLLEAHGTYNWPYVVERRRREAAARVVAAATAARLAALGAAITEPVDTYVPSSPYVSAGRFKDFTDWSEEQHVDAGHIAYVSPNDGKAVWVLPKDMAPVVAEPQPTPETPEEQADRIRREALDAGLAVAAHVRREFLKAAVLAPSAALLEYVRQERIASIAERFSGSLTNQLFDLSEGATKAQLREAIKDFSTHQLDALGLVAGRSYEEREMESVDGWGPTRWGQDYCAKHRTVVETVFGYTFSDIEREAIDYIADQRANEAEESAAREAAAKAKDDQDEDEDGDDE